MKKTILLLGLLLLGLISGFAQQNLQNTNWVFGENAGLNFKTNTPTAFNSSVPVTADYYATVSDTCGNLLFITDGWQIWKFVNGNYELVYSGLIDPCETVHGVVIVPRPGHQNSFYMVTSTSLGLFYTAVNCDDWSLPAINIQLYGAYGQSPSVALTSTVHSNGANYWLVSCDPFNAISSYLVSENGIGIGNQPSYQSYVAGSGYYDYNTRYVIKIAPDSSKLTVAKTQFSFYSSVSSLHLGSFDNSTGAFQENYSQINQTPNSFRVTGVEYSPDSNVLYFSTFDGHLYKCFFNNSTLEGIPVSDIPGDSYLGNLQRAVDGKIYGTTYSPSSYYSNPKLIRINEPNNYYSFFNTVSAVDLAADTYSYIGLPQWIHSQTQEIDYSSCQTIPFFNKIAPVCQGTLFALPTESINGVTGTWTPAIDSTITTAYTFTPTSGQSATTSILTVEVNEPITPTFNEIGIIDNGPISYQLPTISREGIVGTWNPPAITASEQDYVFTPNEDECAVGTTMSIIIFSMQAESIEANDDDFSTTPIVGSSGGQTPSVFNNDSINFSTSYDATGFKDAVYGDDTIIPSIVSFSSFPAINIEDLFANLGNQPITISPYGHLTFVPGIPDAVWNVTYKIINTCTGDYATATATAVVGVNNNYTAKPARKSKSNPESKELLSTITVYPNPGSGIFNIDLSAVEESYDSIKIYNLLGTVVYESRLEIRALNKIDLSNVADGYYMARVFSDENSTQIKLIKKQ